MSLLPEKKSVPKQSLQEYMKLVYGFPGAGKTPFICQEEKTVIALFEDGTSAMSAYTVNLRQKARQTGKMVWEVFLDLVQELIETDHPFKSLAVDTIDRGAEYCMDYYCKKFGVEHPSDEAYGKGWRDYANELKRPFKELQMSDLGLTVVSHSKFKEVENAQGKKKDKIVPALQGSASTWFVDESDFILLLDRDDEDNRIIRLEGSTNYDAQQRLEFEKGIIPMGSSAEEAYANFKKEFDKAIKKRNKELGITEEMIEDYYARKEEEDNKLTFKQLLNEVASKCSDKGIEKKEATKMIMKDYGKKRFSDLSYEQLEEFYDSL